jgi:regulator of protease activity HflC (stomatin/prohibitin superfamily)
MGCLICRIVPEKTTFVIERFGKFNKILDSGLHLLIPLVRGPRGAPRRVAS